MKALRGRIGWLEHRFRPGDPKRFRMTVRCHGGGPGLEGATCHRSLWPDGTIAELVKFKGMGYEEGAGTNEEEEFRTWIETLPVDGVERTFPERSL